MAPPARCAAKPAKPPRQRRAAGAAERRWQAREKPQELQHSPVVLPSMRPPGPATAAASAPGGGGVGGGRGGEKPQELQHSRVVLPSRRPPGPATAAASAPDGGGYLRISTCSGGWGCATGVGWLACLRTPPLYPRPT